jgi:hypothetical protein
VERVIGATLSHPLVLGSSRFVFYDDYYVHLELSSSPENGFVAQNQAYWYPLTGTRVRRLLLLPAFCCAIIISLITFRTLNQLLRHKISLMSVHYFGDSTQSKP